MYWERDGEAAGSRRRFGRREPRRSRRCRSIHVDHARAAAFAAGRASACRPSSSGRPPPGPTRRANLDGRFGSRAGAYATAPPTAGRADARRRLGVDSRARGYPGFEAFPYRRVLRGLLRRRLPGPARRLLGDPPQRDRAQLPQLGPAERRQIFSGFRCAEDADSDDAGRARASRSRSTCPQGGALAGMAEVVREGLSCPFKELPPKYFYDERGSELFERITELPEYYPTRCEREILAARAAEIVAAATPRDADRARLGRRRPRAACCSTRCATPARSRPTCRSTSPRRSPAASPTSSSRSTRGCASRASSATTRPTSSGSRAPRARCSPSSAARSATSARRRAARSSPGSRR